jgi:protein-disulfide isomerase
MIRTKLLLAVAAGVLATAACKNEKSGTAAGPGGAAADAPVAVTPPADGDWSKVVRATATGGMMMGNPNAKVRLVEFASLTCHICADFSEQEEPKLIERYVKTGKASFEFRNFVRDPLDVTASLIARCNGPATFFPLINQMFADQKAMFARFQATPAAEQQALEKLAPAEQFQRMAEMAGLTAWAAQRGVPSAKAKSCMADQKAVDQLVQMNSDASSQYQIQGTPSFLVNDALVEMPAGAPKAETLMAAMDKAS